MHLLFLGTGTCNAGAHNPSSIALSAGGDVVCVDFGGGAYHQLARAGGSLFDYRAVAAIVLTHFHVDHVSGLPDFLWGEMWDSTGHRDRPLVLAGPHGLRNFYEQRLLPFIGDYPLPFEVRLVELADGETFTTPVCGFTSRKLAHGDSSTGYLVDWGGAALGITGDTGYCDALVDLVCRCGTLVCEWSNQEAGGLPKHLGSGDIVKLVSSAGGERCYFFTHMYLPAGVEFDELVRRNRELLRDHAGEFIFPRDGDRFVLQGSEHTFTGQT